MFLETTHDDAHNDWQGSKTRFHRHKASVQPSSCCLSHQPFGNANRNWDLDGDDEQFDLQEYCNLVPHIVGVSLVVDSYLVDKLPRGLLDGNSPCKFFVHCGSIPKFPQD